MRLRVALVSLHRWVGLTVGILLFVQGLTGASMVFRDELNRALHRTALTVVPGGPTIPVQALSEKVATLHPELRITRIEFPREADQAYWFRLEKAGGGHIQYVSIDPYRGNVTRDAPLIAWPAHWLFELHHQLLLGAVGDDIIGAEAVALLFLVVLGVWLWWPGRKHLRRGFQVKLDAGVYRGARDLHRVAGVIVALVLLTSATTAILFIWRAPIQAALSPWVTQTARPSPKVAPRLNVTRLPIDTFVASARAKYGDAVIKSVRFPGGGNGRVVAVYLQASGTTRPRATDQIWFNGYTGATLASYEAASVPPGAAFFDWALPIHTGQVLGMPGRILFLLAALTLPAMVVTGFLQWLQRKRVQWRAKHVTGR